MEKIQEPQVTQHKFDQPMKSPPTHRELYELRLASHFIPCLKILEEAIGREQVIKSLQELAFHGLRGQVFIVGVSEPRASQSC